MEALALYPLLLVPDVQSAAKFYETHLGFERVFDTDWYVHMRATKPPHMQLAVIVYDHDTIPEAGRKITSGLLLSFEVADAAAEYDVMVSAGVEIAQPLRDEVFGQRHFIAVTPMASFSTSSRRSSPIPNGSRIIPER